ncbi:Ribonuclease H-like domain,HAT, C-terminal dimerisation domain [Cinara cedri]|uniref:Ribonuclease H-like domain,HAT, C-terminal dimerisation domain n=1 Tax=Cinara cedri TaxID=506608 RepID=A0A5E4M0L2_9HEMI|nr:Ribonuclease H-like domain,HAT, C-terminal dimerisation domain [Cinara cedri]
MEYRNFTMSFSKLQSGICPKKLHENIVISDDTENSIDEDDCEMDDEDISHNDNLKKMVFSSEIFELLNSFKLASSFPNLYMAYKSLCTIPATSVSSERSFSKVKLINIRLRSTIG